MGIFKLNKNNVGYKGEKMAEKFLKKEGYKVIDRNWCNKNGRRIGEVDIIARDIKSDYLVFIEVKTRNVEKNENDVLPEEQITRSKLNKLNRIAEVYIKENELWDVMWRIDTVSVIIMEAEKNPRIKHIESIFL
ncbi:MAG: YraN family protein [Candidatus Moraniibacteriota bacterium]|jgi:putative endonuclease